MFEKLGVLADIHGNAWALEAALRHAEHSVPRLTKAGAPSRQDRKRTEQHEPSRIDKYV
jgi:hypothetical protein